MTYRSLVIGSLAILSGGFAVSARTPRPQRPARSAPAGARPPGNTSPARPRGPEELGAFFKQTCSGCHNEAMAKAGRDEARKLQIDKLDPANVDRDRRTWELIVRKVRAGQMPPAGLRRPDAAVIHAHLTALENEL